ncbi:MAG: DUF4126 domain-containing protein [Anaerolineae bacterium]|nr:MAG: DUF4126 domain-containing protein [Anaerolineae bacterium]
MIDAITGLATSFGLSTSAGLNAYLPLLIVALAARFTDWITLNEPWNALTSGWVIALLAVLLAIEVVADKIPAVDHANDVIQTLIRPAAGAILFAASSNVVADIHPALAMACGVIVAGGVHVVKATTRPAVTATTAGVGNPVVSTLEDITSAMVALLSILIPTLIALFLLFLLVVMAGWYWRRTRSMRS